MTRTILFLVALAACGARTEPIVESAEMLAVTCWFECTATQIDYCNVNCGNVGPRCFPQSQAGVTTPARVQLCVSGATPPAEGIAACMRANAAAQQDAWLGTLGIRREWPCGLPDPGTSLPRPRWTPETVTVTGFSCRPHPTIQATTSRTVCYSP